MYYKNQGSVRKQLAFCNATTGFPAKRCLRSEHRNYILVTRLYPDLGCAFDWFKQISHPAQPIRSTTQIWVVTHHRYGISTLISQSLFRGETSGSIVKFQLLSQAIIRAVTNFFLLARKRRSHREFQNFLVLSLYLVSIKVTRTKIYSDIKTNSQPPALGDNPELFCGWLNPPHFYVLMSCS